MNAVLFATDRAERAYRGGCARGAVRRMRRDNRRYCLHPPFGTRWEGERLAKHAPEQRSIAVMRQCVACGMSLRAIAAYLPGIGVLNRAGKPFAATQVGVILRRLRR